MLARLRVPVDRSDQITGPPAAFVTLVMYGDYECHSSAQAYAVVQLVRRAMKDRIRLVFRHFPITHLHPHAQHAAEAAEAAADRGRFWHMHELLYGHQDALEDAHLVRYAASVGLDADWFAMTLRVHSCAGRVQRDFLGGVQSGVHDTPTFFINNGRYEGDYEVAPLLLALQGAWHLAHQAAAPARELPNRRRRLNPN
jgi:protein-disulfide isomerase